MLEVAILIGLQASGKTTFYETVLAGSHVQVSKDAFRNARHRQSRQMRMIADALDDGRNVAVDNTNPSPDEWRPIVELARDRGAKVIGYWFVPDVPGSLVRNAARSDKTRVPDVGLYATIKRLTQPTIADGFDELYAVQIDTAAVGGFGVRPLDQQEPDRAE